MCLNNDKHKCGLSRLAVVSPETLCTLSCTHVCMHMCMVGDTSFAVSCIGPQV